MNGVLTETDSRTGKKTLSPVYALLRSRRKAEIRKDEPEQKSIQAQTPKVEPAPVPAISLAQQEAVDAIAQLRAGVPFNLNRGYPQTAEIVKRPKIVSLEEQLIHTWQTNSSIRAEFTSFGSYQAYMRGVRGGRIKTHGVGKIIR